MRQIKFRAWDKHDGKWLFGYEMPNLGGFNLIGEVVLFGELARFSLDYYQHIVFMQFTGLLDKNGKEIYEGDVVRNWQGGWNVVVWGDFGWQATISEDQSSFYSKEWWDKVEVIGNIYENPEILTTKT